MSKLEIDACIGSEIRDSQGETLSVTGADISELSAGKGRWNDNHGKGFFNSLGRVTYAKKVLKAEDATTDRERYYWDKVKSPYIYAKGYLYDDDHMNAKATAAILKSIHKSDAPLKIKASVEGGVVSRGLKDPSYLARTKIHSVALTFTPANSATLVEPLNLVKNEDHNKDTEALIKSVMHLAKDRVPSFIDISDEIRMHNIKKNIEKINTLVKEKSDKFKSSLGTGKIEERNKQRRVESISSRKPISVQPVVNISDPPKNDAMRTTSGKDFSKKMIFKRYAEKAMKSDSFLSDISKALKNGGASDDKVNTVIKNIKFHMDRPFGMSHKEHANKTLEDRSHLNAHVAKLRQRGATSNFIDNFTANIDSHINPEEEVNKAMAAGYAGVGSPMQATGGSVLQSENIKGFKYITCDSCGDEQVYMSNQIKCRKCGKNYSMRKLYDFLT